MNNIAEIYLGFDNAGWAPFSCIIGYVIGRMGYTDHYLSMGLRPFREGMLIIGRAILFDLKSIDGLIVEHCRETT